MSSMAIRGRPNSLIAWPLAIAASMAAHAALLALLQLSIAPDPVPFKETIQATVDLSSMEVPSDRAEAQEAQGESAEAAASDGERLGVQAVPTSRARPVEASGETVAAQQAAGQSLSSSQAGSPAVAAVSPAQEILSPVEQAAVVSAQEIVAQGVSAKRPESTSLSAAAEITGTSLKPSSTATTSIASEAPQGQSLAASSATAPSLPAAQPESAALVPSAPTARVVAASQGPALVVLNTTPNAESLGAASGGGQTVAAGQPDAQPLDSLSGSEVAGSLASTDPSTQAHKTSASLAWSGGSGTQLDEKSLATIQSLMRSGDIAESQAFGGSARDQIGSALERFPCSRLQAAFLPETGGLEVRGHVPADNLRGPVVDLLTDTVGGAIPIGGSILVLPKPQCGLLNAVENLGFPQSRDQEGDPLVMGQEAQAAILEMEERENVIFTLQAPEFDAYIYVDYYDKDGQVVHVLPNEFDGENRRLADEPFQLGGTAEEGAKFQMTVAPPFGQDIAVVLGSSQPLYEGLRPIVEDAATYLEWLKARIEAIESVDPNFRGEWAYLFIKTGPQGAFR